MISWVVASNPGPLTLDGTRTYLVGQERLVVIDPGPAGEPQLRKLRSAVRHRAVDLICLTHAHRDHSGCAAAAGGEFDAPIAASSATLDRCGIDGRPLRDGDRVAVDGGARHLRVVEAPGHSADHLAFLLQPERQLFTGDLVLGRGSSVVLHPDGNMGDYLETLARLIELTPSRIYPGHGPPADHGVRLLKTYVAHRREREGQIHDALRAGARTVGEIREAVYGAVPRELASATAASIRAHLIHLREQGVRLGRSPDGDATDSDAVPGGALAATGDHSVEDGDHGAADAPPPSGGATAEPGPRTGC